MVGQNYLSQEDFCQALKATFNTLTQTQTDSIKLAANLGQKWFEEKLGWIKKYQENIPIYLKMVEIVHKAEKQLSHQGINQSSQTLFLKEIEQQTLTPRLQNFIKEVSEYLTKEGNKIPANETLWSNSNILESIFGKFKFFMETGSLTEINKLVLTIPLCTIKITEQFIKDAMESVSIKDVENWATEVFGQSTLSKKKEVLNQIKTTQKSDEKH